MSMNPFMFTSKQAVTELRFPWNRRVSVVYNRGLKEQELKKAIETCRTYCEDFIAEWHKRFG